MIATAFSTIAMTAAADPGDHLHGPHMWSGGGWMGWFVSSAMMIAMVAIIVGVAVWLIRALRQVDHRSMRSPAHAPVPSPLDVLKERYARGEIDKDEFEERRQVLDS